MPSSRKCATCIGSDQVDEAMAECDAQRGSVANRAAQRPGEQDVLHDANHDKETRLAAVKQDLDEATALELPMLSKPGDRAPAPASAPCWA